MCVCVCVRVYAKLFQSCPTLCDPMDSSSPGSSAHGILQARILEWVTISFSRGSSQPRDWTRVSTLYADTLTSEPPGKPKNTGRGCYFLLQGNFLTQGLNLCVLHWQEDFYNCVPWETQHKYSIIIIEPRSLQNGIHCKILSMLVSIWKFSQ